MNFRIKKSGGKNRSSPNLLGRLLVLPEQVVEDGPVLLVDPLHLVDVLRHLLHADERLHQVLLLVRPRLTQLLQLLQQQRVLEDPLDGLDQVGLQGGAVLLTGVQAVQEVLQGLVAVACNKEQGDDRGQFLIRAFVYLVLFPAR